MVAQALYSPTPDPLRPLVRRLTIPLKDRKITGKFIVLVARGTVLVAIVAIDVPGFKPGTPFGLRERRIGKSRRIVRWYVPNTHLYKMLRMYRDRISSWVTINASTVRQFGTLAGAEMLARYGVSIIDEGELKMLRAKLQLLLPELSRSWDVDHVRALYQVTPQREGTRATLGFASLVAHLQKRLGDLEDIGDMVVNVSAVIADYIDKVMTIVRLQREELDKLLAADEFFSREVVEVLSIASCRLLTVLTVRPYTHVGASAPEDCTEAAGTIERLLDVDAQQRTGSTEGIRNLLVAARNSLTLLERQYEFEELNAYLGTAIHEKRELSSEDWQRIAAWLRRLLGATPESLGTRFTRKSNPVPKIRLALQRALEFASDRDRYALFGVAQVKIEVEIASLAI